MKPVGPWPSQHRHHEPGLRTLALWNHVVRPPRAWYDVKALGPKVFHLSGVKAVREDVELRTPRGLRLQCSHYRPVPLGEDEVPAPTPIVVYLHGNSSSRLEALHILRPLLVQRIAVFCYDAAGCGLSEGEYVSLGWYERDDLAAIIDYLRRSPVCSTVGIWGRSMGAATALLHCGRDSLIGAVCADSSFASLPDLMRDLAQSEHTFLHAPDWLLTMVYSLVRMRVQSMAGFDVEDVVPIQHVKNCHMPALFVHARRDGYIPLSHTRSLYQDHAGDKELLEIGGDHNSIRGRQVVNHVVDFFCRAFRHGEHATTPPGALPCRQANMPPLLLPKSPDGSPEAQSRQDVPELPLFALPAVLASSCSPRSVDSSRSRTPRTPRPLPRAPPLPEEESLSSPPFVVAAVSTTSGEKVLRRRQTPRHREQDAELAAPVRKRCMRGLMLEGDDKENRSNQPSPTKSLTDGLDIQKQDPFSPFQESLARVSVTAQLSGALELLEDFERTGSAWESVWDVEEGDDGCRFEEDHRVYPSHEPSLISPRSDSQNKEKGGVYPLLMATLFSPHRHAASGTDEFRKGLETTVRILEL
mmetsp:Transcript_4364/g.7296  ORF Transcript_4364/g.7296 Transcript_4364/m.7296 type:complete len:584 (-) Transcript_4364:62-1813(-)